PIANSSDGATSFCMSKSTIESMPYSTPSISTLATHSCPLWFKNSSVSFEIGIIASSLRQRDLQPLPHNHAIPLKRDSSRTVAHIKPFGDNRPLHGIGIGKIKKDVLHSFKDA